MMDGHALYVGITTLGSAQCVHVVVNNMWNFIKWFFGKREPIEYKGSSPKFEMMYEIVSEDLDNELTDTMVIIIGIDLLITHAKTEGDARLIEWLQTRMRHRMEREKTCQQKRS